MYGLGEYYQLNGLGAIPRGLAMRTATVGGPSGGGGVSAPTPSESTWIYWAIGAGVVVGGGFFAYKKGYFNKLLGKAA